MKMRERRKNERESKGIYIFAEQRGSARLSSGGGVTSQNE